MSELADAIVRSVDAGAVAGAVALIARHGDVEVVVAGLADVETERPMTRDTIVRVSSMTTCVTAVVTAMLVEDGLVAPDDAIVRWLPELAAPTVVRTPGGPLDDVVPAERDVTVRDLLTSTSGWGFASDFGSPAVGELGRLLRPSGPLPASIPAASEYLHVLARTPMAYQPGQAFLYDISLDVLGILLERASGAALPDLFAERLFAPLGMVDTGFFVPDDRRHRFASLYDGDTSQGFSLVDAPDGQWSTTPPLTSGAGGLVSTADDWLAFCRLLLGRGSVDGARLLAPGTVAELMTNHLSPSQRGPADLFLDGQGWGYGGGVDVVERDPWNVVGRYGWVGGCGTSGHVIPSTGTISITLSQMTLGAAPPQHLFDSWTAAARHPD